MIRDHLFIDHQHNSCDAGQKIYCGYSGPSMRPTLHERDFLEITPYREKSPGRGDVILFMASGLDRYVIHRVVRITSNGVRTRGDNCAEIDLLSVQDKDIVGRITAAFSHQGKRKIYGGLPGRLIAGYCRLRRLFLPRLVFFIRPAAHALRKYVLSRPSFLIRRLRLISFHDKEQSCHRLMLGTRIVAVFDNSNHRWNIQTLYRPFINESLLPKP